MTERGGEGKELCGREFLSGVMSSEGWIVGGGGLYGYLRKQGWPVGVEKCFE